HAGEENVMNTGDNNVMNTGEDMIINKVVNPGEDKVVNTGGDKVVNTGEDKVVNTERVREGCPFRCVSINHAAAARLSKERLYSVRLATSGQPSERRGPFTPGDTSVGSDGGRSVKETAVEFTCAGSHAVAAACRQAAGSHSRVAINHQH
ncbi:hypothetical protein LSAT2_009859, partial [Lamellibrachia satsuma]